MRSIKDIISKPSEALAAMCDGLEEHDAREDFTVAMYTYGTSHKGMCYGCAATCAVQKLADVTFLPTSPMFLANREEATKFIDLAKFERAINYARMGDLELLFSFFDVEGSKRWHRLWDLEDETWKEQLHYVRFAIKEMQEAGV